MNRRKIRVLENHVLPDKPKPAKFYLGDEKEIELLNHANRIRQSLDFNTEIWNDDSLTLNQKCTLTLEAVKKLSPSDSLILEKNSSFQHQRLFSIIEQYFEDQFPETSRSEMLLHIAWFLIEMEKLGLKEHIINDEWIHNRNEDDSNFDDFEWWDRVDGLIEKEFPNGVFTEKSLEALREYFDKKESELIQKYWKEHPEEYDEFINELDKKLGECSH